MKINRRWIFLTAIVILTITIAGVGKASPTEIALVPSEVKDIDPGGTFNVDITITDVSNLFTWQVFIRFDPKVLHVENITEGPFLASTGEETVFLGPTINNTKGYLFAGAIFMAPFPEYGVTGDGVLATIIFSVVGRGKVTIEIDESEDVSFLQEVKWADYEKYLSFPPLLIPVTLVDGTFENGAPEILSLPLIVAIVVAVAICGVGAFFLMRRRRT